MAAAQLGAAGHQDLETAIDAAVKRHHEEELQHIKDSLAKTVRLSISCCVEPLTQAHTYRQRRISK